METNSVSPDANLSTRDGLPILLFAYFEKQTRPYIGVYYNVDEWISCSWHKDGTYLDGKTCALDMIITNAMVHQSAA